MDERQPDPPSEMEPNEEGFAGAATAPQPEGEPSPREPAAGEEIAVPGDDLTAPIMSVMTGSAPDTPADDGDREASE
jgi:hypothetical protein